MDREVPARNQFVGISEMLKPQGNRRRSDENNSGKLLRETWQ